MQKKNEWFLQKTTKREATENKQQENFRTLDGGCSETSLKKVAGKKNG